MTLFQKFPIGRFAGLCFLFCLLGSYSKAQKNVAIILESEYEVPGFALSELKKIISKAGYSFQVEALADFHIRIQLEQLERTDEGFILENIGENETVLKANDTNGLLYGIFAMEEQLKNGKELGQIAGLDEKAALPFRAIKFNLPWDSYRRSEALQMHTETVRDIRFWESFLDMMVRNRFNVLTLWNLHPFNYLIRAENFPEATGFTDEELADWQQYWNLLFAMAKERGIETYLINWNIFVSPEFAKAHDVAAYSIEGKYFSDGDTSEIIKKYTRESVTQVLNEYPDLAGLGVSLGEGMGGMTPREREEWILETVVAGMQEADRPVKLIHRAPFSADLGSGGSTDKSTEVLTRAALDTLEGVEKPIYVEAKFNWSHAHSTPKLVKVHGGPLSDTYWNPEPENYKMTWMMRNEDFFALRWGQVDFIREHIHRNSPDYVAGYYVGSECYIPAKDYFTKLEGNVDWEYAFERQWLFYQTWGRLLYNPETPDDIFIRTFDRKYGKGGKELFEAHRLASRVPLHIASLWDVAWDYTLYSEGFLSVDPDGVTNLISVDDLIQRKTTDPDYISVADYVDHLLSAKTFSGEAMHPPKLAGVLQEEAEKALEWIGGIDPGADISMVYELSDVQIWSNLGLYLAEKLLGALELEIYRKSGKKEAQEKAVLHLEKAASYWDKIIAISEPVYLEMPLVHNNRAEVPGKKFHWANYREDVQKDIETAKLSKPEN